MNYAQDPDTLKETSKPFAIVIMVHLNSQTIKNDFRRYRLAKIEIIRSIS
ncbi:hypothetical protein QUF75_12050 [Desulfococcaceae bacterium HSG7]|nr:hypothetical protein [Desulfococcaceae bacterium HSG7]